MNTPFAFATPARLIAALGLLLLSACATPTQEERAARVQQRIDEMIAVYGPGCAKLGYAPESDPWRECILKLGNRDEIAYLATRPVTTSCFGHRGFYNCSTF